MMSVWTRKMDNSTKRRMVMSQTTIDVLNVWCACGSTLCALWLLLCDFLPSFSLITEYRSTILLRLLLLCPMIRLTIEMVSISIDLWMVRYQDIYRMHLYSNRQIKYTFYHNERILLVVHLRIIREKRKKSIRNSVVSITLVYR